MVSPWRPDGVVAGVPDPRVPGFDEGSALGSVLGPVPPRLAAMAERLGDRLRPGGFRRADLDRDALEPLLAAAHHCTRSPTATRTRPRTSRSAPPTSSARGAHSEDSQVPGLCRHIRRPMAARTARVMAGETRLATAPTLASAVTGTTVRLSRTAATTAAATFSGPNPRRR